MEELSLYTAIAVSIDDEDKQGKVRIRILPEQEKLDEDLLPWAMPFILHLSENTLQNDLPEEGSTIRVLVDKTWKRFYYLGNRYFNGLYDFSKVTDALDSASVENVDKEYKNLHFMLYADGTLTFHNDSDGSHGIIQSTGSFAVLNADGSIYASSEKDIDIKGKGKVSMLFEEDIDIKGKSKISMLFGDDISFKGEKTNKIEIGNAIDTLGGILGTLMDNLASLKTIGSPSTHTSPELTAQMTALKAKLEQVFK